jgi:hypothetical protein
MAMPQDLWHRTGRKVHADNATFIWTGHPALLRDLGLGDLGPFPRIMITKVPEALWTVAFE